MANDAFDFDGTIPIIRLYEDLIVVLQGRLTDRRVDQLKHEIPQAIDRHDARGVVINLAGVDVLDSYISRTIYDVAVGARMMGVETVVCGINGLMAMTLAEMGMGMGAVPTTLNLERALELLASKRAAREVASANDTATDLDDEMDSEEGGDGER